jgi:hypothetical protein
MGFVSGFRHDIFISYAHYDNEEDAQGVRWVSRFQLDFKNALRQRLGGDLNVCFDERNLEAGHNVDFLIESVRQSAVFLAILSPSYISRDFTINELRTFCERIKASPVVTVELLPVADDDVHRLLRGRKRTPFWWKEPVDQDVPLRLTPKFNPTMYNERLQILAHQLKKILIEQRQGSAGGSAYEQAVNTSEPNAKAVLLAQTTDDLYDQREQVRSHLEQFGLRVLPENDYPQGGVDFAAGFDADLTQADLFVQLLGSFGSRKPPDLPVTYSQYQYAAARNRGVKVLQWRHPDLNVERIDHRDRSLLDGSNVLCIGLQEFKAEIVRLCVPPQSQAVENPRDNLHIFINADRSDQESADALLKAFEDKNNWTVARPLFEGSAKEIIEDLEENLQSCTALMLLYGNAPPAWVRAQLLRYRKLEALREVPPKLKTIVFGPPTPKAELAWSGGFERIDCEDGNFKQRIRGVFAELER